MRLDEFYRGDELQIPVSIELFPPKTRRGREELFERVEQMKRFDPKFFSMTYGAAGSTRDLTLGLVERLKNEACVETMCHLTVVGQSQAETRAILQQLRAMGIDKLIALRGDPPSGAESFVPHPDGFLHAAEPVHAAVEIGGFSIAVAGFPERHPESPSRESDLYWLKAKVDAGACLIITQLFFENRYYFEFVESLARLGVDVPVVPGILPIVSVGQVRRFTALCKATIPDPIQRELERVIDDDEAATALGIEIATRQCEELIAGGAPGLHFYSLNRTHSVEQVLTNLGHFANPPRSRQR